MKALSARDARKVWACARDLFTPNSWTVPKTFQDWKVKDPLLRELRLTNNRYALLTDAGLASWRATATLLDKLDISEGLAAYSDISSSCREVLEECLSNGVEPENAEEFLQLVASKIEPTISAYTYIVSIFGVALKGIDELNLGAHKILPCPLCSRSTSLDGERKS